MEKKFKLHIPKFNIPMKLFNLAFVALISLFLTSSISFGAELPLHLIKLPDGFQIDIYAEGITNARSLARSPNGTLFVGTRTAGNVYALVDENDDYTIDKVYTIATGLNMPNGIAFKDGNLYVAEIHRVIRFDNIEKNLNNPTEPIVVNDSFHNASWHGWKYLRFSPDNKLYVSVGAPCNTCVTEGKPYGQIMRMNVDGSKLEAYAFGVRQSVGFDFDPTTGELWFTDNGRDQLGDDIPPDELNHAPNKGLHFGFPYCHGVDVPDPKFGKLKSCIDFTPPAKPLGAHVASLGMRFYIGDMFPPEYKNQVFIAEHGSWNRSRKVGYQVSIAQIENNRVVDYKPFASGWKVKERYWGRPVDILNMPDGSILVSDDYAHVIYRISYGE